MKSSGVNTAKVGNRRTLHFTQLDQAVAEAERLAAADGAGKLRQAGNWTYGQTLGHLAGWVDYSFNGVPMKIPFIAKLLMKPMKRRFIYSPMKPGAKLPKIEGGTLATEVISTEEGIARLRSTFGRLRGECPKLPHVLFGPLTHDEWINQHLRHAELHLSFYDVV